MGGAGADIFYLELEPEPNQKISGAGAKEKWFGSATLQIMVHLCRNSKNQTLFDTSFCAVPYLMYSMYSVHCTVCTVLIGRTF